MQEKREWRELAETNGELVGRIEELEEELENLKAKDDSDSIHNIGKVSAVTKFEIEERNEIKLSSVLATN